MQIRRFEVKDAEAVVALWTECGLVVPWNDPYKDIERKLSVQPELFLVGESDGEVVATVMAGYEGHRGWINYLAVSPSQRGRQFARQLLSTVEQRLKALGCPKINLQVRETNAAVIEFYQYLGFDIDRAVSMGKRLIPDLPAE